jgi:N-acetylneuraminic acid mutarotase
VGARLLVLGGGGAGELSSVESAAAGRRWHVIAHLPGPRSDLLTVTVPGGLLVVGGYDGTRSSREVLRSHDGRHFVRVGQLRQGVRYAAAVRVGGSVWVFGGEDRQKELRTVQRINTATGSVTVEARLPRALGHSAAAVMGSRILLMGGRTGPHRVTDQMLWFDPESKRFSRAGRLPYPVADAGLLTTGSTAYLMGGETPNFTDRVMRIEPVP